MPDASWLSALFMAASIALFAIAIGITVLTLFVTIWGRDWVSAEIEKQTKKQGDLATARMEGYVGFIFGQLRTVKPPLLNQAIDFSRNTYQKLPEEDAAKIKAINNLAFYLSLRADPTDGVECTELARLLRQNYSKTGRIGYLNTYAAVVATYHTAFADPQHELEEALAVVDTILNNTTASQHHKDNALRHKKRLVKIKGPKKKRQSKRRP